MIILYTKAGVLTGLTAYYYYGGTRGYYGFDYTYLLVIAGFIFSLVCSSLVNSTYSKYDKEYNRAHKTGAMVAEEILRYNGINDVKVVHIPGNLTDNYNPVTKTVSLSDATYQSTSVAAAGVAAHECGHVIQHHVGYIPIKLRNMILPVANFGTKASYIFIILGCIFSSSLGRLFIDIGIYAFLGIVAFQVVTLPVELDASHRALKILKKNRILDEGEVKSARKVLTAAAMTYVAAVANALISLLRLILIFGSGNRRR